jgi:hypothetical protein
MERPRKRSVFEQLTPKSSPTMQAGSASRRRTASLIHSPMALTAGTAVPEKGSVGSAERLVLANDGRGAGGGHALGAGGGVTGRATFECVHDVSEKMVRDFPARYTTAFQGIEEVISIPRDRMASCGEAVAEFEPSDENPSNYHGRTGKGAEFEMISCMEPNVGQAISNNSAYTADIRGRRTKRSAIASAGGGCHALGGGGGQENNDAHQASMIEPADVHDRGTKQKANVEGVYV